MSIEDIKIEDLAEIIAGLVKQGITFEAYQKNGSDFWNINLTGGY